MPAQKNRKRLLIASSPEPPIVPAEHRMGGVALARHLVDPARDVTVVVLSHIPDQAFRIDAQALASRLGTDATVIEVTNGPDTHQLEKGLPAKLHIFGTGARVYPSGKLWQERVPRPHLPHHAGQLPALYDTLEREVLAAQRPVPVPLITAPVPVVSEAIVKGFLADDRAMVELTSSGEQLLIRSEDLLPAIPLHWLLAKGQKLSGLLDPETHALNIKALLLPRPSPVTVYRNGDVALARVKNVDPRHATVELWPGSDFRIGVERISSNDLDSAEDLLTEGEVVRVRVLYENGAVVLSMLDVDDDETPVPPPSLLRGGPPWLDLGRPYASIFTTCPTVALSTPEPGDDGGDTGLAGVELSRQEAQLSPAQRRTALQSTQMQLVTARRTIDELMAAAKRQGATDKVARALQDQLEDERRNSMDLARSLHAAEHQVDALRAELAKTKASLVQIRQQRRSSTSRSENAPETLFVDPVEQFAFELQIAWAQVVPAVEKSQHPLGKYTVGPVFLASWSSLTAQQRAKALRVMVELVAGWTGPLHKREPHVLRLNDGAKAPPTMRGEDVCWRLYVEQGTAGALRLHYWKLKEGGIELHAVVTHDVVKP